MGVRVHQTPQPSLIDPNFFLVDRLDEKTIPEFFQIFWMISSGCSEALKYDAICEIGPFSDLGDLCQINRYMNETLCNRFLASWGSF